MVTWLRKIFIKDYQNVEDGAVRLRHGVFASLMGIVLNTILIALKMTAALLLAARQNWVFSMALVGDSINNLGDLSSSVVSLVGFKSASKPADKEHPFGHERMEYIASLIVSMIIIFAAVALLKQSITQLVEQSVVDYDIFAYIVFGSSILIKSFQSYLFFGFGKAINSPVLKGVGLDSILDVISSSVLLLGALLASLLKTPWLDGVLGIAIACFVAYSGIKMVIESSNLLLGGRISKKESQAIIQALLEVPGVLGVHDLLIHEYGASHDYIAAHIEVDETLSLLEAHKIADQAEDVIKEKFSRPIIIHVDPKSMNQDTLDLQRKIEKALQKLHKDVSIHDLQISGKQIDFDILLPYENKTSQSEDEILRILKEEVSSEYDYNFVVDHPFDQED